MFLERLEKIVELTIFFFELQYVFECVYDRGRIGSISVRILESGVLSIKDFNCTYFFLPIKY